MFIVMEFKGKGDPFFGGSADDRPLGKTGKFLSGTYHLDDVAEFETKELGEQAAEKAERRPDSLLGVFERAGR